MTARTPPILRPSARPCAPTSTLRNTRDGLAPRGGAGAGNSELRQTGESEMARRGLRAATVRWIQAMLALLLGSWLAAPCPALGQSVTVSVQPNIILILADDLGYGDLGCYGQKKMRTPHIDQLAEEGMRFTDCYAGAPVCGPSRCVLMTGRHTGHSRIRGNHCPVGGIAVDGKRRMHLTDADLTVGNVLQQAGYRTCLVGKWHLEGYNPEAIPLNRGFDEFYGWQMWAMETHNPAYYPPMRFFNREIRPIPENADGQQGLYETDLVFRQGCDFILRNTNRPFFLFLAPSAPHTPLVAPDDGPYAGEAWPPMAKTYAAMVHYLDRGVGWIMETLHQTGLDTHTIVFFTSDNGPRSEPRAELTEVADFFDSNGPLRGYKRDMYEGGIRIPMIVRWPGHVHAGRTDSTPWYFADFMATAADLAGARPDTGGDGISMMPSMLGTQKAGGERLLYWEFFERGFEQAARWGQWKIVRHGPTLPGELYNLTTDMAEQTDAAGPHPELVTEKLSELTKARTDSDNWPVPGKDSSRRHPQPSPDSDEFAPMIPQHEAGLHLVSTQVKPPTPAPGREPTLFLIGDSTVKNGSGRGDGGLYGWGQVLAEHFDPHKITIENRARGGRSSRTYLTEGLWKSVLTEVQPGDFVMMQFGHNDGGPMDEGRARASVKGVGPESQVITNKNSGVVETVHSYGWYLRNYIADTRAKGATPIVLSPVPRNIWKENHVVRASSGYGQWAAAAARQGGALFIDLNELVSERYESAGQETVAADYFTSADHTHTTLAGAKVNAAAVAEGVEHLTGCPLREALAPAPVGGQP